MKITELTVENVKRISMVTITPEGNLTIIGGEHGAGKTSLLDAIEYLFAGRKSLPPEPLSRGKTHGKIAAKLDGDGSTFGPMIVTRRLTRNGAPSLDIRTADGQKLPSPQTILEGLYGQNAFDPLAFRRLPAKQQAEAVRELLGLDFEEADRKRAALYDERTIVNREAKSLGSQLDATPKHEDAPEEEVLVAELAKELERRLEINGQQSDALRDLDNTKAFADSQLKAVGMIESRITELQEELNRAKREHDSRQADVVSQQDTVAKLHRLDTDDIRTQMMDAEDTNSKVRENALHTELHTQCMAKEDESLTLSEKIDRIDADKAEQTAAAKFPVDGMGFGDDGLILDDFPFEQANMEKQIRASVAMAFAANPTLPLLLIREGSLVDVGHLPFITKLAEEHRADVWMERVGEGDECTVIIADGMVKGDDTDEHD